jgi:UDPglucose 6-dehydrogenase
LSRRVSIIGLGYVGLSTAVCFSHRGFEVYGVDVDRAKLERIMKGDPPFYEKGMAEMLKDSLKNGRLRITDDVRKAVGATDTTFITVGTPSASDGSIDLTFVKAASKGIGHSLVSKIPYHLIVVKSTVAPGTTLGAVREILQETSSKSAGRDFGLAFNPEFLREGSAVEDTFNPDLLILGVSDEKSRKALTSVYREFYRKLPPLLVTTPSNAEIIKYAVNTFRATQLSFLNTLANLCERIADADVYEVISGFSRITKVDPRYLRPGLGFGGSCLPKDLRAFIHILTSKNVNEALLSGALEVNEKQHLRAIEMAKEAVGELAGRQVAVLGLAYKAKTDDVRDSVAVKLVRALLDVGAKVSVYDPRAITSAGKELPPTVRFAGSAVDCIRGADCCIIATEWEEFGRLKPTDFVREMKHAHLIDSKRLFKPSDFVGTGVQYRALGLFNRGLNSSPS